MEEKLKPCPFCGAKALLMINPVGLWIVQCAKCSAMIGRPRRMFNPLSGNMHFTKREEAIEAWNRRSHEKNSNKEKT